MTNSNNMTNNGPCGCEKDYEEEKDAPIDGGHECCGGTCHDNDNSKEDACGGNCGCGHDHEHAEITPEQLEELKKAIMEAGYKIEETPEGEIRILEK